MLTTPSATPSDIQITAILSAQRECKPWPDAKRKVAKVNNRKTILNEKIKQKKSLEPVGTSFHVVIEFRQYVDKLDIFLMYDTDLVKIVSFQVSKTKMGLVF